MRSHSPQSENQSSGSSAPTASSLPTHERATGPGGGRAELGAEVADGPAGRVDDATGDVSMSWNRQHGAEGGLDVDAEIAARSMIFVRRGRRHRRAAGDIRAGAAERQRGAAR